MNVMVFTMVLWSQDVYRVESDTAFSHLLVELFQYLCLLFALPVLFLLGGPILEDAWQKLRRGTWSTELLIMLGVSASFAYSAVSVFAGGDHVYFEVGCMVLVALTLGRWLEATGRLHATDALEALERLLPNEVTVVRHGQPLRRPLAEIAPGDDVRVLAGERVPTDGRMLGPAAWIDEQIITGESLPRLKQTGDPLYGGTLNLDGTLTLRVTSRPSDGTLARLVRAVRHARGQRGEFQRLADRATAWFVPVVSMVALAAFAWHAGAWGFQTGLQTGLAVLLIACPCALGLATPMAVWAALGRAARLQIVFRDSESLERLAAVRVLRFDKTGTLTSGSATVCNLYVAPETDRDEVLARSAALAECSRHSVARAIGRYAGRASRRKTPETLSVETRSGLGLVGRNPNAAVVACLGNVQLMASERLLAPPDLQKELTAATEQGATICCIGWAGRVRGVFVLSEEIRPQAAEALAACRRAGYDVAVLTGDHPARGEIVARQLGVPVQAGLLPEQKVAALKQARRRSGPAAMIGDGINDAPALAASDVGIAMGCGADVSRESASVCLLSDDLTRVPLALDLARQTVRVIRQNLFWAFAYNVVGIVLAASGRLNPILAAMAMAMSSLFVVSNSLRLRHQGPPADSAADDLVTENGTPLEAISVGDSPGEPREDRQTVSVV